MEEASVKTMRAFQHAYSSLFKSAKKMIDRSINRSIDQSINPSIHQSINRSIDQSINPSIDQSINQYINQFSTTLFLFILFLSRNNCAKSKNIFLALRYIGSISAALSCPIYVRFTRDFSSCKKNSFAGLARDWCHYP